MSPDIPGYYHLCAGLIRSPSCWK